MRTALTGARRDTDADLVRRRMDALFAVQPYAQQPHAAQPHRSQPYASSLFPTQPCRPQPYPAQMSPERPSPGAQPIPPSFAPPIDSPSPSPSLSQRQCYVAARPPTDPAPYSEPLPGADEPRAPVPPRSGGGRPARSLRNLSLPLALQERLDLDRRAMVGLSVLLLLALGYGVQHFWSGRPEPLSVPVAEGTAPPSPGSKQGSPSGTQSGSQPGSRPGSPAVPTAAGGPGLVVDVAGRVREPGVRTLPAGSRVQDALRAAGGAVPGTDLTGINQARLLNDGEEIVVGAPPGAAGAPAVASGPLSLNAATAQQLDALPGVGPVLAQRIIQYRDQHGGFTSLDQLKQVSGFGERRLQDLRALLRP
ncbi:helix-hairpin-helix domain-containing protein [Streptacidiphilus sp. EB129]|uniref:helix-hairpin-helix domain-containing protein n=1 Tax=Streptacidiphilus sp. EB129 TaxID=3156262 RepID=UPI003515A104